MATPLTTIHIGDHRGARGKIHRDRHRRRDLGRHARCAQCMATPDILYVYVWEPDYRSCKWARSDPAARRAFCHLQCWRAWLKENT